MKRSLEVLRSDEAVKVAKVAKAVLSGSTDENKAVVASGICKDCPPPAK